MTFLSVYLLIGLDGSGNSSYIDNVILRERDANTSWTSASDGTLEERRYYCQNWRADVSALLTSGGVMVEWTKYSPYGIPFGLPGADTDSDGDCDATDISNFDSVPSYDVRYDIDLDGDNDATDKAIAQTYYQGTTYGWDTLSSNPDTGTGNRKGYAGYEYHEAVSLYHIRNRVLHPELGRWTRRDPLGYVDGMSVYEYVGSITHKLLDPFGTSTSNCFDEWSTYTYDEKENCCCTWARDWIDQEPTLTAPMGYVVCCQGEKFPCVNEDILRENFGGLQNDSLRIAMKCSKTHEQTHLPDICCPAEGNITQWGPDESGDRVYENPIGCADSLEDVCGECRSYISEGICVWRELRKSECDQTCKLELREYIDDIIYNIITQCADCNERHTETHNIF